MSASATAPSGQRVVRIYLASSGMFTLAVSLIWGVNTLFLLGAGLDIFQVMLVNAAFSAGTVLFEVPTGVVADTVGRKISFLWGMATLFVSTALYLAAYANGWSMWAFAGASFLLGIGFTFQTGAVDAWLIDALDHVGHEQPREEVFARGGVVAGVAMLVGTLSGGFLGQLDLQLPYVVRCAILVVAMVFVAGWMRDIGFEARPLRASSFGAETRTILRAGVRYGLQHRVVRPLLLVSLVQGVFFFYLFYAAQPFALDLLGRPDLVWVSGALAALFGLTGVVGNLLVKRIMNHRGVRRAAPAVLAIGSFVLAVMVAVMGAAGLLAPEGGSPLAFGVLVGACALFGVMFGVMGPVRQAFLNEQIPSAQRATVLSVDSFFADAGNMFGQPGFGWLARATSIPMGYAVGAVFMFVAVPLYRRAGRAAEERGPDEAGESATS